MSYKVSLRATARDWGAEGKGHFRTVENTPFSPQHPGALFLALLLIESGSLDSGAEIFLSSINDIFSAAFFGVFIL